MPGLLQLAPWIAVFLVGVAVGALVWRSLTFRRIREIEAHWQGENADLRERLMQLRLGAGAEKPGRNPAAKAAQSDPAAPPAGPDDLTRIKGIGKKIAGMLNDRGVTTYAQIAAWSDADIDRIQHELRFPGRVRRDKWVERAREEHARKYGKRSDAA